MEVLGSDTSPVGCKRIHYPQTHAQSQRCTSGTPNDGFLFQMLAFL